MPLSRDFKTTIRERVQQDPQFTEELFTEAIECLLSGDLETGKAILRAYINATVGFQKLGDLTQKPAKSLMRMFSPKGNPQARNLFEVLGRLQEQEGFNLRVELQQKA